MTKRRELSHFDPDSGHYITKRLVRVPCPGSSSQPIDVSHFGHCGTCGRSVRVNATGLLRKHKQWVWHVDFTETFEDLIDADWNKYGSWRVDYCDLPTDTPIPFRRYEGERVSVPRLF